MSGSLSHSGKWCAARGHRTRPTSPIVAAPAGRYYAKIVNVPARLARPNDGHFSTYRAAGPGR
ncbi:hypothetical protein GCM10027535_36630 [Mycolicibacterium hippocampi]|uniref:Uncharacterized protein n=1 Tax=Mycolicibacterium hippocampi TaxID=659824 RepID=A0A7I9ZMR4_9MYCO|nr:hypothetical protein MHIP_24210 [Mycolicibacterium hippocampi]